MHCYNAIFVGGRWLKVDARGNKPGVNARFSLDEPVLAFLPRPEYDEYFFKGIYAAPHGASMRVLEAAKNLQEVLDNLPDMVAELPDILEDEYDLNLFMMCGKLNLFALSDMPDGYAVRYLREGELDWWKRIHFDDDATANQYFGYMSEWFKRVYAPKGDLFFKTCLVAVDGGDIPVGTCFTWKLHDKFPTVHWFKVKKSCEGNGIGRGLLSAAMRKLPAENFPVYLHTQTGSFRAIKLYSDFGFELLRDEIIGQRRNDLEQGLSILKEEMPPEYFSGLKFCDAPQDFLDFVAKHKVDDF